MKTIVIAGGGKGVGKTSLARSLGRLLPGCLVVKVGTGRQSGKKSEILFPFGTPYAKVAEAAEGSACLIIESGAILDDPDLAADLVVVLPAPLGSPDKPGSQRRRARADLVRGEPISAGQAELIRLRLGMDKSSFAALLAAVGAPVS